MTFDPIDVVYDMLSNGYDWSLLDTELKKEYEVRLLDLRQGNYIVVGAVRESDMFFGLGAKEYMRNVRVRLQVRSAESRQKAREIVNRIRDIFRDKSNWYVGGIMHLNFLVDSLVDRSDVEKGLYTHILEVRWLVVESV